MKNNDEHVFESKVDKSRAEREERLKALRDKDLAAKKNKAVARSGQKNKIVMSIVTVLVAAIALCYILWLFGIPQRTFPAIRVNNQTMKITDYNYNYFTYYNQYNRAFNQGGGVLDLNSSAAVVAQEEITWREFLDREAKKSLQQDAILYNKAIEAGYSLTDEDNIQIDAMMENMQAQIGKPLDFEIYLESMYGKGMNRATYREIAERQYLAMKFAGEAPDKYEVKKEDVEAKYEEKKDDYDIITYHSFTLVTPTKNDNGEALTQQEIDKKVEENQKKAETILSEITKADEVETVAKKHAAEADKAVYDKEGDQTKHENYLKGMVSGTPEVQDWLFNAERKQGDKIFIKVSNNFEILYFVDRQKDTRKTSSFMVSAFAMNDETGKPKSTEEAEKIQKEAEAMAGSFHTEDDVKAYDEKQAEENVPKANPAGKYEKVDASNAFNLHPVVLNYVLSDRAEAGKATVIKSDNYLYVVTVLEVQDTESWYQQIEKITKAELYQKDFEAWTALDENKAEEVLPGFWFTKKLR